MNWNVIRQWAFLLALAVVTSLYLVDCWDERIAQQEAAEQAILDAEQAERDLHVAIAQRSSDFVWAVNSTNNPDTVRTKAAKEQAAWLDSLLTGVSPEGEDEE